MMRLRRASLIVTLSLLVSTATAYAECAWLLWEERVSSYTTVAGEDRRSESPRAFPDRDSCLAYLTKTVRESNINGDQRATLGPGMSGVIEVSSPWTRHTKMFYCLPDTVDPRGPKGK